MVFENLYYIAKYPPICVYCAKDIEWSEKEYYPQCVDCRQPKIQKSYVLILYCRILPVFVTMMSLTYFIQHDNSEMFTILLHNFVALLLNSTRPHLKFNFKGPAA